MKVENYERGIRFRFWFSRPVLIDDLEPLWMPGGPIFEGLVEKGYMSKKGINSVYFRMDEVRPFRTPQGTFEVMFNYYLIRPINHPFSKN